MKITIRHGSSHHFSWSLFAWEGDPGQTPYGVLCTRWRIRTFLRPAWLWRVWLRACRLLHGVKHYRVTALPDAGKTLRWDVRCMACGSAHRVETPHGWGRNDVQMGLPSLLAGKRAR